MRAHEENEIVHLELLGLLKHWYRIEHLAALENGCSCLFVISWSAHVCYLSPYENVSDSLSRLNLVFINSAIYDFILSFVRTSSEFWSVRLFFIPVNVIIAHNAYLRFENNIFDSSAFDHCNIWWSAWMWVLFFFENSDFHYWEIISNSSQLVDSEFNAAMSNLFNHFVAQSTHRWFTFGNKLGTKVCKSTGFN